LICSIKLTGGYVVKYTLKKADEDSLLYSKNNIVTKVNNQFMKLTGYPKSELIGKSLTDISRLLRIDSQVQLEIIESEYNLYMFTSKFEPKEVIISCKRLESKNENIYHIKYKPNTRFEDKLPFAASLLLDNKIGIAIYSITDGILLRVNKKFLDFWNVLYKEEGNIIGRTPEEAFNGFKGSNFEKIFFNVITTHKPYYSKELKYENLERGDTYCDVSFVPICISGEAKYIIHTTYDITEKVINRKLVEEQKEELEAIIQNMSDGLLVVDKDYNCFLLNKGAREFVYKADSFKRVGDTFGYTKYYNSEGNLLTIQDFYPFRVLKGERLKEYRVTANRPDGIFHFNISGSPVYDNDGNITKAVICSRDVTEHVNKSKLIITQKEELEAILENMSDALAIFDRHGIYKKFNKCCRDIFLFDTEKINNLEDVYSQAEFTDSNEKLISVENSPVKRILKGEKLIGYKKMVKIKNNIFYTELNGTPIYDKEENLIAGILLIHDITDKVKSEANLLIKAQLDILNNIIENLDVGFVRCSYPEYKIIDINKKAYEGLKEINCKMGSISSIKGQGYFDVYNDGEKVEVTKAIQDLIGGKNGSHFSYIKYTMFQEKYFKIIYQPLLGINNQYIELVVIAIDISEEVEAKNKMNEILKMQEELFANVAHELKTPLSVIFSTNQLMDLYNKNNLLDVKKKNVFKCINIVKQNCYRLTKLINNIVDLSKIDSGFFKLNLSNNNIVQITEDIIQSVSDYIARGGLNIIFDTNTEEKVIACDPDKIERVILNLISNAIKFTASEGSIFVNIIDKVDTVEITVTDTGIGIEKENLDNIFERFQQVDKSLSRNTEGSGIGLTLVKSIVEMHGGKISVESEVEKGSIFKIELPSRTVESPKITGQSNFVKSKVETINIELSDIYSI